MSARYARGRARAVPPAADGAPRSSARPCAGRCAACGEALAAPWVLECLGRGVRALHRHCAEAEAVACTPSEPPPALEDTPSGPALPPAQDVFLSLTNDASGKMVVGWFLPDDAGLAG